MNTTNGRLFVFGWLALVAGFLWFLFSVVQQVRLLTDIAVRTEQRLDRLESGLSRAVEASQKRLDQVEASLRSAGEKASATVDPLLEKINDPKVREALSQASQSAKSAAAEWLKRKLAEKPAEEGK